MSDNRILKADKDFSKEVDKQLPEAQDLAKVALGHSDKYKTATDHSRQISKVP